MEREESGNLYGLSQEGVMRFLGLIWGMHLWAATTSGAVVLAASGQAIVYPIDSHQRGTEIVHTFSSLTHASGTNVPEVALQTKIPNRIPYTTYKYLVDGTIPYVQAITQTTYNTLLIVSYVSKQAPGQTQYVVVPTESITALLYFPTQDTIPTSAAPFIANPIPGTLPFYSVDPRQRAIDIASAVTQLMKAPFLASQSQVWMQITLVGPFNPPVPTFDALVPNGLLKNVTAISVDNSLIQIQYQPPNQGGRTFTVFVGPEQVLQITYIQNINHP